MQLFTRKRGESLQITNQRDLYAFCYSRMTNYFWKFSTNVQENKKERERSSVSNPFEREALQPSTTERGESLEITHQRALRVF